MDFTTIPTEWFKAARIDLQSAELSKNKKNYGDYIAKLQHSEEKLAKGILAIFSILRGNEPNKYVEQYFNEISDGTFKTDTAKNFTHDWEEKFFENVLNKDFLISIKLPEDMISAILRLKASFDSFKYKKPHVSLKDLDTALFYSRILLSFSKQENPLNNIKEIINEIASENSAIKIKKDLTNEIDETIGYAIKKSESAAKNTKLPSNIKITDRLFGSKLMIILTVMMPIHSCLMPHFKADFPSPEGVVYDEKNPLVIKGPEIESILKESINISENIYNELKTVKSNYIK